MVTEIQSENLLRFKIKNELEKADYERLKEFLKDSPSISIKFFPGVDLAIVSINPIIVAVEGIGCKIDSEISFKQPIGFEVYDDLELSEEVRNYLAVDRGNFKLSTAVMGSADIEKNLNMILRTVERIANHICNRFGILVEQTFTINSEWLDMQLDMIHEKVELEKRGEVPRPFGTIHAKDSGDAKERAGDLVPVYVERDKAYLYEDKKVFILLPRKFVMKLLKIEGPTMIAADQFTEEERQVLDKFSMRQYIRTTRIRGKAYYYNLDETTRKLLLRNMKKIVL